LILAYAAGHCSVIVLAGTSAELLEKYLRWNKQSKGIFFIKKMCGILIIIGGLYLLISGR